MILSNLEQNGSLLLMPEGQTKAVTVLTDTSTVPNSVYYDMPDGFVPWLTITVNGNVLSFTADNNLFNDNSRTVRVRIHCLPSIGGTWQDKTVDVTQSADTLDITFSPVSVIDVSPKGTVQTVTLTGSPQGAQISHYSPSWVSVDILSSSSFRLTVGANPLQEQRSTTVQLTISGRSFYYLVSQTENDASLVFDVDEIVSGHEGGTETVTVTGVPGWATPTVSTSESWVDGEYADGVVTLTVKENKGSSARNGTVTVTVAGREFLVPILQGAAAGVVEGLSLDVSSFNAEFTGGTVVVTAIEMPSGSEPLTCRVNIAGKCVDCSMTDSFVKHTVVSRDSIRLDVDGQDIFDGTERTATVVFEAGGASANVTIVQDGPPQVHRLRGHATRYVKSVLSEEIQTSLSEVTAKRLYDDLKEQTWRPSSTTIPSTLVVSDWDETALVPDKFDAFKAGHNRRSLATGTVHQVSMGAAAYGFEFVPEAYGQVLRGLSFFVRTDGYCDAGLRVSIEVGEQSVPSSAWNTVRHGTASYSELARRTFSTKDNLFYGTSRNVLFDGIDTTIGANTRIYVYITLEDYEGTAGGWLYGSGIAVPSFDFYTDTLAPGLDEGAIITDYGTGGVTGYIASGVRFLRRYMASRHTPVGSAPATGIEAERKLAEEGWRQVRDSLYPTPLPNDEDIAFQDYTVSDQFDAFFGANDYTDGPIRTHRVHAGAACYRVALPYQENTDLLSVFVTCNRDDMATQGARIALFVSDDSEPPTNQHVVRYGMAHVARVGGSEKSQILQINLPVGTALSGFLYIYVSMEEPLSDGGLASSVYLSPEIGLSVSKPLEHYPPGSDIGGGYFTTEGLPMVLVETVAPADLSHLPYREVAEIRYEAWGQLEPLAQLELSVQNKWVASEGGTFTVGVTSLPEFYTTFAIGSQVPDWMTVTITGTNILFNVKKAEVEMSRSADIVVVSGEQQKVLHIDQQATERTYLTLSTQTHTFVGPGGSKVIEITSFPNDVDTFNAYVPANNPADWISITNVGQNQFTIVAEPQEIGAPMRNGFVRVDSGTGMAYVQIYQQVGEARTYFELASQTATSPYTATNGSVRVNELPNGIGIYDLSVLNKPDWVTVTFDTLNWLIKWSTTLNGTGERTGNVVIGAGGESQGFTITQAKNPSALSIAPTHHIDEGFGGVVTATITVPAGSSAPTWSSSDGVTATISGSQVTITTPANTGGPRTISGAVSITIAGSTHTVDYYVFQGSMTTTSADYRLGVLTSSSLTPLKAETKVSGIKQLSLLGTKLAISGSFQNLFGEFNGICVMDVGTNPIKTFPYSTTDTIDPISFTYPMYDEFGKYVGMWTQNWPARRSLKDELTNGIGFNGNISCRVVTLNSTDFSMVYSRSESNLDTTSSQPTYDTHRLEINNGILRKKSETEGGSTCCQDDRLINTATEPSNSPFFSAGFDNTGVNVYPGKTHIGGWFHPTRHVRNNAYPFLVNFYHLSWAQSLEANVVAVTRYTGGFLIATKSIATPLYYRSTYHATAVVPPTTNNLPPVAKMRPTNDNNVADFTNYCMAIDVDTGRLIVGGSFKKIGGQNIPYLARWTGSQWEPYGNIRLNGPVTAIAAANGKLYIAGEWTQYSVLEPPPLPAVPLSPPLPPVQMNESQIMHGVRDMYARAFAKRIRPKSFETDEKPSRQLGLCASLVRDDDDTLRLSLSALLTRLEVPTTFRPTQLRLTTPPFDMLNIPEGTHITLTAWWAANEYVEMSSISAVSNTADFWSGAVPGIDGSRTVILGETTQTVRANIRKVGSVKVAYEAWAQPYIRLPVKGIEGTFGSLLLTAWLHVDGLQDIGENEPLGIGKIDVDDISGSADLGWKPTITLLQ